MGENQDIKKIKYITAIEARHKLNDDFHKWMTFYYVANGAILVALTSIHNIEKIENNHFLILTIFGILVSVFWNLSCKGYYYWSLNWIKLIKKFEKEYLGKENLVYGAFSEEVIKNEKSIIFPLEHKNISTPKLTMLFSLVAIICWTFCSVYLLENIYLKLLLILFVILIYLFLPKCVKSRMDNQHIEV